MIFTDNVYNFFNTWINDNLDTSLKEIQRDNIAIANYILNTLYFFYWGKGNGSLFSIQDEIGNAFRAYAPVFLMFTAFHGDYFGALDNLLTQTKQQGIPGMLYIAKAGFIKMGDLILAITQESKKGGAWLAFHLNNRKSSLSNIDIIKHDDYRGDKKNNGGNLMQSPEDTVESRGLIWNSKTPVAIKIRFKDFVIGKILNAQ